MDPLPDLVFQQSNPNKINLSSWTNLSFNVVLSNLKCTSFEFPLSNEKEHFTFLASRGHGHFDDNTLWYLQIPEEAIVNLFSIINRGSNSHRFKKFSWKENKKKEIHYGPLSLANLIVERTFLSTWYYSIGQTCKTNTVLFLKLKFLLTFETPEGLPSLLLFLSLDEDMKNKKNGL